MSCFLDVAAKRETASLYFDVARHADDVLANGVDSGAVSAQRRLMSTRAAGLTAASPASGSPYFRAAARFNSQLLEHLHAGERDDETQKKFIL